MEWLNNIDERPNIALSYEVKVVICFCVYKRIPQSALHFFDIGNIIECAERKIKTPAIA